MLFSVTKRITGWTNLLLNGVIAGTDVAHFTVSFRKSNLIRNAPQKESALFFPPSASGSRFESVRRRADGGEHLIFCNYTQSEPTEVCKRVRINKRAPSRIPRLPRTQTNASSGAVQFSQWRENRNKYGVRLVCTSLRHASFTRTASLSNDCSQWCHCSLVIWFISSYTRNGLVAYKKCMMCCLANAEFVRAL